MSSNKAHKKKKKGSFQLLSERARAFGGKSRRNVSVRPARAASSDTPASFPVFPSSPPERRLLLFGTYRKVSGFQDQVDGSFFFPV